MNLFRLLGDFCHVFAVWILFIKIWRAKSVEGISGKSQILFALTYTLRYLDLLEVFISAYNTSMKIMFVAITYATLYSIYHHFNKTYNSQLDTFRIEILILGSFILGYFVNSDGNYYIDDLSVIEYLWTVSIYLEAVAILPQLFMVYKLGELDNTLILYLFALGSYRGLYIFNWIYRYYYEDYYDPVAIYAGVVQTIPFFGFCLIAGKVEKAPSYVLTV